MKKLFLLFIGAALSMSVMAQNSSSTYGSFINQTPSLHKHASSNSTFRTTSHYNDSETMTNGITPLDSPQIWITSPDTTEDSGYVFGQSNQGYTGFAQRYDFKSSDSSIQVLGILSLFSGAVNPASTNHVVMKVWTVGAPSSDGTNTTYSGLPNSVIDSVSVPFTSLNVPSSSVYDDTFTSYPTSVAYFATPTAYLTSSFFVGFTMNYTWGTNNGDTVFIYISDFQQEPMDSVVSGDTIVNNQSVIYGQGSWSDNAWDQGIPGDYYMFPIVNAHVTEGVKGITKNDLTFFGNYPNPANDMTNIKFSLANNTDVTITIMDMSGRTINTINEANLAAGVNIIPVNTSCMPSGDYLYLVRTASGAGIASKMTVIR